MSKFTAAFYDRLSFAYPLIDYFLEGRRNQMISEVNEMLPGKLLEIGVGNGLHLPFYKTHQVTGIDISKGMLDRAKKHAGPDVQLELMDGERMTFSDSSFDYVVMSHVLAVAENPDKLLNEVYRVLKPGGRLFIINHFTPGNFLGWMDKLFDPISRLFHFRSRFYLHEQKGMNRFTSLKQLDLGPGAYFKLLIFERP